MSNNSDVCFFLCRDLKAKFDEITLWLFNIAIGNGQFIDDVPIKTSIYEGSSIGVHKYDQHVPEEGNAADPGGCLEAST
jgi:hypothetical protein